MRETQRERRITLNNKMDCIETCGRIAVGGGEGTERRHFAAQESVRRDYMQTYTRQSRLAVGDDTPRTLRKSAARDGGRCFAVRRIRCAGTTPREPVGRGCRVSGRESALKISDVRMMRFAETGGAPQTCAVKEKIRAVCIARVLLLDAVRRR